MIICVFDWLRDDRLIGQIEFSEHGNKTEPLLSHSNTMKTRDFSPTRLDFFSACWKAIKREPRGELAGFKKDSAAVSAQLIISNVFIAIIILLAKLPRQITVKSRSISGLFIAVISSRTSIAFSSPLTLLLETFTSLTPHSHPQFFC